MQLCGEEKVTTFSEKLQETPVGRKLASRVGDRLRRGSWPQKADMARRPLASGAGRPNHQRWITRGFWRLEGGTTMCDEKGDVSVSAVLSTLADRVVAPRVWSGEAGGAHRRH